MRREELPLEREPMRILPRRTAVDPNQGWVALAGDIPDRLREQRMNLGAILASETDVLRRHELELCDQCVVVRRQLPES